MQLQADALGTAVADGGDVGQQSGLGVQRQRMAVAGDGWLIAQRR